MTNRQYKQFQNIVKVKTKVEIHDNFTIDFKKLYEMPDINDSFLESLTDKLPKIETYQKFYNICDNFHAFMYTGLIDIKDYYCLYSFDVKSIPRFDDFYSNYPKDFNKFFLWLKNTLVIEYTEYQKTFINCNL